MISSDNRRYAYGRSQLIEVICQLRFPTILSIDASPPTFRRPCARHFRATSARWKSCPA